MDCKKTCNVVEYFVKNVTTDLPGRPGREVLNPVKAFPKTRGTFPEGREERHKVLINRYKMPAFPYLGKGGHLAFKKSLALLTFSS